MRFQEYITEKISYKKKTRSKIISDDEIKKILHQYSDAINIFFNGRFSLIRQTDVSSKNIYILDPKKSEKRKSKNTSNYYTLLVDGSKKWSQYPKRSQSIICRTDHIHGMDSIDFWVIPKNGAKIGMTSDNDFWYSFSKIDGFLNYFNQNLERLLNFPYLDDKNIEDLSSVFPIKKKKTFDINISTFKKACKKFDSWFNNETMLSVKDLTKLKIFEYEYINWLKGWNGKSIYNYIDSLFDPKSNDFKLVDINGLKYLKEAWTDSTSIIVPKSKTYKIFEMYKEL